MTIFNFIRDSLSEISEKEVQQRRQLKQICYQAKLVTLAVGVSVVALGILCGGFGLLVAALTGVAAYDFYMMIDNTHTVLDGSWKLLKEGWGTPALLKRIAKDTLVSHLVLESRISRLHATPAS